MFLESFRSRSRRHREEKLFFYRVFIPRLHAPTLIILSPIFLALQAPSIGAYLFFLIFPQRLVDDSPLAYRLS
ncbi:hypothetical protein NDI49_00795 [Trichocoleus sp. ST-U3]